MNVPPLRSGTRAAVVMVPNLGADGAMELITIVKEQFAVDAQMRVTRTGDAEVRLADVPWDEDHPEASSIRFPADLSPRKPSTDVVVVGDAVTPDEAPRTELDVLVRVGPVSRALRVFGMRVWYEGAAGLTLTTPQPFTRVPLRWELAFGGYDGSDPERPVEDARNPLGRSVARDARTLVDKPGPQIEDPQALFGISTTRPAPAGVGAIGRHWLPRRQYAGTYDALWTRTRMPLPPTDLDARFHQSAPPELVTPTYLRGGESVEVLHMNREGALRFELPRLAFFVGMKLLGGALTEFPPALDTVLLRPTERLLEMTWRSVIPLPRRVLDVAFVQVHEKERLA